MKPQAIRYPDFHARRALRDAAARGEHVSYPPRPQPEYGLVNSLIFLLPFALICAGVLLARAWGLL